jgi:hypothetical protein
MLPMPRPPEPPDAHPLSAYVVDIKPKDRPRPRRSALGSGNGAALTITASGLAGHPRRGKANPAPALLVRKHL